jgi:hypothetical protein
MTIALSYYPYSLRSAFVSVSLCFFFSFLLARPPRTCQVSDRIEGEGKCFLCLFQNKVMTIFKKKKKMNRKQNTES